VFARVRGPGAMEGFFHVQLSDCGTSLPPQDAAIGDPQKPWLFGESLKWAVFARIRGQGAMEDFFHVQLSDCGTSLPPQDAAIGDPQKPWLFGESLKWAVFARVCGQGATEGFFHVQLVRLFEAEGQDRAEWFTGWPAE